MTDTKQISLRLPQEMLSRIDTLVEDGLYQNRGDVIRDGMRQLLNADRTEVEENPEAPETPAEESHSHDLRNCATCRFAADCDSYSLMPDSRCERFEEKEAAA